MPPILLFILNIVKNMVTDITYLHIMVVFSMYSLND